MSKEEFKRLADLMVKVYGVDSYQDNDDDADLWFACPECGEAILYDDFADSSLLKAHYCPICEERIEG